MIKTILELMALLTTGWIAGAEMGSWFGIQPIVNKLPYEQQVHLERAMLKTYGKVMPVLMPLTAIVVILLAVFSWNGVGLVLLLRTMAAVCVATTIITTLIINVPINKLTATWNTAEGVETWTRMRTRWHAFQGLRSILLLLAFILLTIGSTFARS